jgi:5-methylcytosine-specific restriction endonuclease McrA
MATNVRYSNGNARRKLRAWLRSQGLPCAICGQPIDYTLPSGHPLSFEVDEVRPVSRWREFGYASPTAAALDRENVQPVHRICNERKGKKLAYVPRPSQRALLTSRER